MIKGKTLGSAVVLTALVLSLSARDEGRALAEEGAAAPAGEAAEATRASAAPAPAAEATPTPPPSGERGEGPDRVLAASEGALTGVRDPSAGGACPEGMVEVEGEYCPRLEQRCLRYMDPEGAFPRRCAEFAPTGPCATKTAKRHFCIDRYEWPNQEGEEPLVMKTWYEARDACARAGKRLCGDTEWTVACEGQERLPYPYGYERSAEACNIDKPHPAVNERALGSRDPAVREAEARRLWQGEPSGARPACVSPYGVFDMTGNVDEWVVNESGRPYRSGLKGGYWGPVRDRCRPMTTAHSESFSFYQIGFRCCADVPEPAEALDEGDGGALESAAPRRLPRASPPASGVTVGS